MSLSPQLRCKNNHTAPPSGPKGVACVVHVRGNRLDVSKLSFSPGAANNSSLIASRPS